MKISSLNNNIPHRFYPVMLSTGVINPANSLNFTSKSPPTVSSSKKLLKKDVILNTVNNKSVSVSIYEADKFRKHIDYYGSGTKVFFVKKGLKELGYLVLADSSNRDSVMIYELFTCEHNKRKYKGVGTELLKAAVQESIKRGYDGRAVVYAAHVPQPFVFYYKNNFRPFVEQEKYTPALDFVARNPSLRIEQFLPNVKSMYMRIDEDGARALLNGKRLYKYCE